MHYYEIRDINGNKLSGGTFNHRFEAINWYKNGSWSGWLYVKINNTFYSVEY